MQAELPSVGSESLYIAASVVALVYIIVVPIAWPEVGMATNFFSTLCTQYLLDLPFLIP